MEVTLVAHRLSDYRRLWRALIFGAVLIFFNPQNDRALAQSISSDAMSEMLAAQAQSLETTENKTLELTGGQRNDEYYRIMREFLDKLRERQQDAEKIIRLGGTPKGAIAPSSLETREILERADESKLKAEVPDERELVQREFERKQTDFELEQVRTKIFFGWEVKPGALAETIAFEGRGGLCSGVLIGEKTILTAAHCFCDGGRFSYRGTVKFGETISRPVETIPIYWTVMKESNFCRRLAAGQSIAADDLAIAVLQRPPRRTTAQPSLLMDFDRQYLRRAPKGLVIVGFGKTDQGGFGRKRYATVPIASKLCQGPEATYHRCAQGREVVLGWINSPDTCHGDSGGPVYLVANETGLSPRYIAAITSRGTGHLDCGSGGIYTLLGPEAISWLCRWQRAIGFRIAGKANACG